MTKDNGLPPRVFLKGASYYYVRAEGKKRVWVRLSKLKDGLPGMYSALAKLLADDVADASLMPKLIADWERDVMARHAAKTRKDEQARNIVIAKWFRDFRADDVETTDVAEFLKPLKDRPRTHNLYRAQLRELMRYASERGFRPPGSNPVSEIRTMTEKARGRYVTDDELVRIKEAAMVGADKRDTTSGPMLCCLIDMAYLTGQRIGDLLQLRWELDTDDAEAPHMREDGIWFKPQKIRGKTGAAVLIEWTPALRDLVTRLKELKLKRPGSSKLVFVQKRGKPYTYWGASSAWQRAVERAGVQDVHFHDLRAKALTDKDAAEGMTAARTMGAHSTESQTADYVRHKTARKTKATR